MREREEANVKWESSFDGLDAAQIQSFDVQHDLSLVCIQSRCKFGSRPQRQSWGMNCFPAIRELSDCPRLLCSPRTMRAIRSALSSPVLDNVKAGHMSNRPGGVHIKSSTQRAFSPLFLHLFFVIDSTPRLCVPPAN